MRGISDRESEKNVIFSEINKKSKLPFREGEKSVIFSEINKKSKLPFGLWVFPAYNKVFYVKLLC